MKKIKKTIFRNTVFVLSLLLSIGFFVLSQRMFLNHNKLKNELIRAAQDRAKTALLKTATELDN